MIPDNVLQCPKNRQLEPKSRWQLPPQVLVYYSLLLSQTNLGQAVDRFGRPSVSCMDLARVSQVVETDSSIFPLHRLQPGSPLPSAVAGPRDARAPAVLRRQLRCGSWLDEISAQQDVPKCVRIGISAERRTSL